VGLIIVEGNMRKQTTCSLMVEECGLFNHLKYGGLLIVGLVDKPWRFVAGLLLGLGALFERQWTGTPMGVQKLLVCLFVLWIVDTLSGMLVGWQRREFSSSKLGCTIVKALVYGLGVITAETIDEGLNMGSAFLVTLTTWMLLREATSIIENFAVLGFPWPKSLLRRLDLIKQIVDEEDVPNGGNGGLPKSDM